MDLLRQGISLLRLPPRAAVFYGRALGRALRTGDQWSIDVGARPRELARLVELAEGRRRVVEIGTGSGWTAIALALADRGRSVWSYDVVRHPGCPGYMRLVGPDVRARLQLRLLPADAPDQADMVFIDSSHEYDETMSTFRAWRERLSPGGVVAFHDYGDRQYPDVEAVVRDLGLDGEVHGSLFVWHGP